MKVAVLDCASLPTQLEHYCSVGQLVSDWLTPHLPQEANLTRIAIAHGDAFPLLGDFDAFILPGSEFGVYDTPEWMTPLATFLMQVRDAKRPLLGICFGHQMMAHTFGGHAAKTGQGMCIGSACWTVGDTTFDANMMHQDQVVTLPPGAVSVGSAPHCPYGAIAYDFPALSFQFHPEYTDVFMRDAVTALEGSVLDTAQSDAARRSLDRRAAVDLYGSKAVSFLTGEKSAMALFT